MIFMIFLLCVRLLVALRHLSGPTYSARSIRDVITSAALRLPIEPLLFVTRHANMMMLLVLLNMNLVRCWLITAAL